MVDRPSPVRPTRHADPGREVRGTTLTSAAGDLKKIAKRYKDVNQFVYDHIGTPGAFQEEGHLFSVKAAEEYAKTHKLAPIVVPPDLYTQRRLDEIASVGRLEKHRPADLSIPGIVLTSTRRDGTTGYRLIDGWNRAQKARKEGKPLLAYPVPKEESDYIEIWRKAHGQEK